jgi:flagellar biosynthesis/type III secretory pathway M-ring protein FliF/YscJ
MSPLAAAPALPLHSAGKYVAGAYIVFVVVILVYVAIMATRLRRTERELAALRDELAARERATETERGLEEAAAGRLMRAPAVASPEGERGPA